MKSSATPQPLHSRAVILARVFLLVFGFTALAVGGAMWAEALTSPAWWAPILAVAIGSACLLSAIFEGSTAVVGTFLIFFFPWT
jgi:uncharacterized membrane protein YkvI